MQSAPDTQVSPTGHRPHSGDIPPLSDSSKAGKKNVSVLICVHMCFWAPGRSGKGDIKKKDADSPVNPAFISVFSLVAARSAHTLEAISRRAVEIRGTHITVGTRRAAHRARKRHPGLGMPQFSPAGLVSLITRDHSIRAGCTLHGSSIEIPRLTIRVSLPEFIVSARCAVPAST